MTTLGTHEGGLPRLAQSLSNNGIRTRWWACISAVILAVACGTAWLVLGAQGELVATKEVLGWPLVAIGESGRSTSNLIWWPVAVAEEPRGWFSIGRRPVGFFAFGFQPTGVIAVGQFSCGRHIDWMGCGGCVAGRDLVVGLDLARSCFRRLAVVWCCQPSVVRVCGGCLGWRVCLGSACVRCISGVQPPCPATTRLGAGEKQLWEWGKVTRLLLGQRMPCYACSGRHALSTCG